LLVLLDNTNQFAIIYKNLKKITMEEKNLDDFRHEAINGLIGYQSLKYNLQGIISLQDEYHCLSFREDACYLGKIKLKKQLTFAMQYFLILR